MKNVVIISCLLFWSVTGLWSQRIISGTIYDNFGQPLSEVTVYALGTRAGTVSGEDGKYSLQIPADSAVLKFAYVSGWSSPEVKTGKAPVLNVALAPYMPFQEDRISQVAGELDKPAAIRGKVYDERRNPIANASVHLMAGGKEISTTTDANGYYEMEIPAGPNTVRFKSGSDTHDVQVTIAESCYVDIFLIPLTIIDRWERKVEKKKKKRG